MKFKIIVIFMTFSAFAQCAWTQQAVRPGLSTLVDSLISNTRISGNRPMLEGYHRFSMIDDSASIDELKLLAGHQNAIIRYYALKGLTVRIDSTVLPILVDHLRDSTVICAGGGDVYMTGPIAGFVADDMLGTHFQKNPPYISQYSMIQPLARDKRVPASVIGLARYRNKNDIESLKKKFTQFLSEETILEGRGPYKPGYALQAICEFPAPEFFPILLRAEKVMKTSPLWWEAIVHYQTKDALTLMLRNLHQRDKDDEWSVKQGIVIALLKHPEMEFFYRDVEDQLTMNLRSFKIALFRMGK